MISTATLRLNQENWCLLLLELIIWTWHLQKHHIKSCSTFVWILNWSKSQMFCGSIWTWGAFLNDSHMMFCRDFHQNREYVVYSIKYLGKIFVSGTLKAIRYFWISHLHSAGISSGFSIFIDTVSHQHFLPLQLLDWEKKIVQRNENQNSCVENTWCLMEKFSTHFFLLHRTMHEKITKFFPAVFQEEKHLKHWHSRLNFFHKADKKMLHSYLSSIDSKACSHVDEHALQKASS